MDDRSRTEVLPSLVSEGGEVREIPGFAKLPPLILGTVSMKTTSTTYLVEEQDLSYKIEKDYSRMNDSYTFSRKS